MSGVAVGYVCFDEGVDGGVWAVGLTCGVEESCFALELSVVEVDAAFAPECGGEYRDGCGW